MGLCPQVAVHKASKEAAMEAKMAELQQAIAKAERFKADDAAAAARNKQLLVNLKQQRTQQVGGTGSSYAYACGQSYRGLIRCCSGTCPHHSLRNRAWCICACLPTDRGADSTPAARCSQEGS